MRFTLSTDLTFMEFVKENEDILEKSLLDPSANYIQNIAQYPLLKETYILDSAKKIFELLYEKRVGELNGMLKNRGRNLAQKEIPLSIGIELAALCRKAFWTFVDNYSADFPYSEKIEVDFQFDLAVANYSESYTIARNEVIKSQREVIEELSTPIIPISATVAILPIIGSMDECRAKQLQHKALKSIAALKVKKLIIDLSGVNDIDTFVIHHLLNIISGLKMLGCHSILTGINARISNTMVELKVSFDEIDIKGDLQQAIEDEKIL